MSDLLRVAIVTPRYFSKDVAVGGAERWATNIAIALARRDARLDVQLISFGRSAESRPMSDRVMLHVLDNVAPDDGQLSWGLAAALDPADIVHVCRPQSRSGQVALLIAKALGKPTCATDLGESIEQPGASLGALELADVLTCTSHYAQATSAHSRESIVLQGGVDEHLFRPSDQPVSRSHFLYAGRLVPHKGVDHLITALPGGVPLVIAGRPDDARYVELLIDLAKPKKIWFEFAVDDHQLANLYRTAWATIVPSVIRDRYGIVHRRPEVLGLTALESLACGTPALVSDVGCLPEMVDEGRTGFVFSSISELSSLLDQLSDDSSRVETMSVAARDMVVTRYSASVVGEKLADLYTAVTSSAADHVVDA